VWNLLDQCAYPDSGFFGDICNFDSIYLPDEGGVRFSYPCRGGSYWWYSFLQSTQLVQPTHLTQSVLSMQEMECLQSTHLTQSVPLAHRAQYLHWTQYQQSTQSRQAMQSEQSRQFQHPMFPSSCEGRSRAWDTPLMVLSGRLTNSSYEANSSVFMCWF